MALGFGPRLGLLISANQGEQHYAEFMRLLRGFDFMIQGSAKDKDLSTPPGSPADGDVYIVGPSATGAWAGKENQLARWYAAGSAWDFIVPKEGFFFHVDDEDQFYKYTGSAWIIDTIRKLRKVVSLSSAAGVVTVDLNAGEVFELTLTENVTSWVFQNLPLAGFQAEIRIQITQDAATPRTVVSPASAGRTAGGAWVVSATVSSRENLGLAIDSAGVVTLFPAGVQS